ncbi:bifunctional DNA primase/polymerase [Desulfallas sp. Bu1-1]|nr:bifunctional DNA primase/polymerase [Desulfallas sp. Bu1-1]
MLLQAALKYAEHGWPITPLWWPTANGKCACGNPDCRTPGKHPILRDWTNQASTDPAQILKWWQRWPRANVGIVTGERSRILLLDVDVKGDGPATLAKLEAEHSKLPDTPETITGSGGRHVLFKYPQGRTITNRARFAPGLDTRSNGGMFVAPPSLHASGGRYEWKISFENQPLADPPEWLLNLMDKPRVAEPPAAHERGVITQGERNDTLTSLAGSMRRRGMTYDSILAALLAENRRRCSPPLDDAEVERIARSVARYEPEQKSVNADGEAGGKGEKKGQADLLIELAESAVLFHDDLQEPFALVEVDGHGEIWPLKSKFFKRWLKYQFYKQAGKSPTSDAVNQALGVIEGKACFEGPEHKLNLRVAEHNNAFWYDLADNQWRAVKITPDGWRIVDRPPILFRRHKNTAPQVEPREARDGIWRLLDFVNLKNKADKYLLAVYIVTCLIPNIPHAIPPFYGEKGAAKSTALRVLRRIVDPARQELLTLPKDKNELVLQLAHNYMPAYDNLDGLQPWQSDLFCCAATGGGISKRELYTDDEEVILSFRRCVTLNGINLVANRSDLLDRSILFELERISPDKRREESEFWQEFEKARPYIMGGIFKTLARAMRIYPTVKLDKLPRMADFCRWGYAVAEALGIGGEVFLDAYQDNISRANEEAIAGSPVAAAVVALMRGRNEWSGTATALLSTLDKVAETERINTKGKGWPRAANALSRRLRQVKNNLLDAGIVYDVTRNENNSVHIIIRKVSENISGTSGISGTQAGQAFQVRRYSGDIAKPGDNISGKPPDREPYSGKVSGDSGDTGDFFGTLRGEYTLDELPID